MMTEDCVRTIDIGGYCRPTAAGTCTHKTLFEVVVARMDTQTLHERTRTAMDTNRHKRTQTTNAYGRKRKNRKHSLLRPILGPASSSQGGLISARNLFTHVFAREDVALF